MRIPHHAIRQKWGLEKETTGWKIEKYRSGVVLRLGLEVMKEGNTRGQMLCCEIICVLCVYLYSQPQRLKPVINKLDWADRPDFFKARLLLTWKSK